MDHVGPEVVLEFGLWLFVEFKIFATQVALELDGLVQAQTIEISGGLFLLLVLLLILHWRYA